MTGGIVLKILILGSLVSMYSSDPCSRNTCLNNGRCIAIGVKDYRCSCARGWTGQNCQHNVNDCNRNSCKNRGLCIDQINSRYLCKCTEQYVGNDCEFPNPCAVNSCQNEGVCVALADGTMTCRCSRHYKGIFCQDRSSSCPIELQRSRRICSGHGFCQYTKKGALQCSCDPDYSGPFCSDRLRHKVGCRKGFCLNGGKCISQKSGNPFCNCDKNFTGRRCNIRLNSQTSMIPLARVKAQSVSTPPHEIQKLSSKICSSDCKPLHNNGICEQQCNHDQCHYDGGDCDPWKRCRGRRVSHCREVFRDGICNPECNTVECLFDGQDCDRSSCRNHRHCTQVYQNRVCNEECNTPQCGFDGGDCRSMQTDSFFANLEDSGKCSVRTTEFELNLVLLTTTDEFRINQLKFLRRLGTVLKMVLTISNLTEIKYNFSSAISIVLKINPTDCVIYGGQCFSSLKQVSDFINAGISRPGYLNLPFEVAKVDSKTVFSNSPKQKPTQMYFVLFVTIGLALIICLIVIGVLLREKWRKLKVKVKTSGIWTPSDGYSTSTLSIASNHKGTLPKPFKPDIRSHYDNNIFKSELLKPSQLEKEFDEIPQLNRRKRKFEISHLNPYASNFQSISETLQSRDGINPIGPTLSKLQSLINETEQITARTRYTHRDQLSADIGNYVNENGESLLHIAARMNSGTNVIKRLNNQSPGMLQATDEWGRTPLATAISSGSFDSVSQLLSLEKQHRKNSKQKNGQSIQNYIVPIGSGACSVPKTTGLIEAVKLNSSEIIDLLLEEGSPVNGLDSMGRSVVHWSAIFGNIPLLQRLSHLKIFQKLVDIKDNDEKTPLFLAAQEGSINSVRFILDFITKQRIKIDPIYPCPKAVARERGFVEIVNMIDQAQRRLAFQFEEENPKQNSKNQLKFEKMLHFDNGKLTQGDTCNEYSTESSRSNRKSMNERDSVGSYAFLMDSLEDSSLNNIFDSLITGTNSLDKPISCQCPNNLSNSSGSEISPPLLPLRNLSSSNRCTVMYDYTNQHYQTNLSPGSESIINVNQTTHLHPNLRQNNPYINELSSINCP